MTFPASGFFVQTMLSKFNATQAAINFVSTANKVALFKDAIVSPDLTADTAYAAAPWNANEVSGTGYTAGGTVVASPTYTHTGTGVTMWDMADTSWTSATFTLARGALIHADALTPKYAIIAITFGADFAVTSGTFTIQWNASGVATIDWIP